MAVFIKSNNEDITEHLSRDYATAQSMGYNVLGVFLQGSQNYHLDYAGSDIDTKCIIIPSFKDIILNKKPVSTTHINSDNSHLDLKDIRLMWECFKKQNINFLEILFTEHFAVNVEYLQLWYEILDRAEEIAHYNNYAAVNCLTGMILEKYAALCHPYPTLKAKIDKYGYDNKQLHHIIRCEEFLQRYITGVSYAECLIPKEPEYLIEVKSTYMYSCDEAKRIAAELVKKAKETKLQYMNSVPVIINSEIDIFMQNKLLEIITSAAKEELLND